MKKIRVAFVCIGNACRSQMAEGFARAYGSDVLEVHSAGLYPAVSIPNETKRSMMERNIDISNQFPKEFRLYPPNYFDLIVNMSGLEMDRPENIRTWEIADPYGSGERVYRTVRDRIEGHVRSLIQEIRNGRQGSAAKD